MSKALAAFVLMCASLSSQALVRPDASAAPNETTNLVVEWNKTLLVILRTPGSQPVNLHPTRGYALMHAAIYDAVNAIDGGHAPYKVVVPTAAFGASEEAAAVTAGHDVLLALYPAFQQQLDAQLQQELAEIADGKNKNDGIAIGKFVAAHLLTLRVDDGKFPTPGA